MVQSQILGEGPGEKTGRTSKFRGARVGDWTGSSGPHQPRGAGPAAGQNPVWIPGEGLIFLGLPQCTQVTRQGIRRWQYVACDTIEFDFVGPAVSGRRGVGAVAGGRAIPFRAGAPFGEGDGGVSG